MHIPAADTTASPSASPLHRNGRHFRRSGGATSIRIAYIGGGSREWAGKLMADLALTDKLTGTLVLHDIDTDAARRNVLLSEEIFGHRDSQTSFDVEVEPDLGRALTGADFVIISIEPGPTAMRHADLEIPLRYGILQTVGDTTGPGGLLRALRSGPLYQRFAVAIMEHCPRAWVINYSNPMAHCVAALHAFAPGIRAFGCCHEVFGTQQMLANYAAEWFGAEIGHRTDVDLEIAGVNHFTFATRALWKGHDLLSTLRTLIKDNAFFADATAFSQYAASKGLWFASKNLVACDLLRRFGVLGAAGERHLVEFVPWYLSSEEELYRWGVLATPYAWRHERSLQPPHKLGKLKAVPLQPSGEEGVLMIEALLGLRPLRTNVNLPNAGQMPALPTGAIVETFAWFAEDRIIPMVAEPLPSGAAALVSLHATQQRLILEATVQGDMDLAFQALLSDPLVRIPTDRAWEMFQEMLAATRHMLPASGSLAKV